MQTPFRSPFRILFHAWERRLASVDTNRIVRPFEWGTDWIPGAARALAPAKAIEDWVSSVMEDTDAFFTPEPTSRYRLDAPETDGARWLTFPSAFTTPHDTNNTVHCRIFPVPKPARRESKQKGPAVLVLPQWNADADGHVGLCKLLVMNGMTAVRLSLPYHDRRRPPELQRADFIVSPNVARTVQVCRQAVLDARRAIAWMASEGYGPIGILGTSLGSCLSLLTTAHEPLIRAQALNHVSPYFADVVWRGLSTEHVRAGFADHVSLEELRAFWRPISPWWHMDRIRDRRTLLVYARYDLSFPVDLSEDLIREFKARAIPHQTALLPCGHYTTGKTPFKFLDGWILTRFLKRALTDEPDRSAVLEVSQERAEGVQ